MGRNKTNDATAGRTRDFFLVFLPLGPGIPKLQEKCPTEVGVLLGEARARQVFRSVKEGRHHSSPKLRHKLDTMYTKLISTRRERDLRTEMRVREMRESVLMTMLPP